jgi:hypothetical protein
MSSHARLGQVVLAIALGLPAPLFGQAPPPSCEQRLLQTEAQLKQEIDSKTTELDAEKKAEEALKATLGETKQALQKASSEVVRLSQDLQLVNNERQDLIKRLRDSADQIATLNSQRDGMARTVKELNEAITSLHRDLDANTTASVEQRRKWEQSLAQKRTQLDTAQKALESLDQEQKEKLKSSESQRASLLNALKNKDEKYRIDLEKYQSALTANVKQIEDRYTTIVRIATYTVLLAAAGVFLLMLWLWLRVRKQETEILRGFTQQVFKWRFPKDDFPTTTKEGRADMADLKPLIEKTFDPIEESAVRDFTGLRSVIDELKNIALIVVGVSLLAAGAVAVMSAYYVTTYGIKSFQGFSVILQSNVWAIFVGFFTPAVTIVTAYVFMHSRLAASTVLCHKLKLFSPRGSSSARALPSPKLVAEKSAASADQPS